MSLSTDTEGSLNSAGNTASVEALMTDNVNEEAVKSVFVS